MVIIEDVRWSNEAFLRTYEKKKNLVNVDVELINIELQRLGENLKVKFVFLISDRILTRLCKLYILTLMFYLGFMKDLIDLTVPTQLVFTRRFFLNIRQEVSPLSVSLKQNLVSFFYDLLSWLLILFFPL